MNRKKLLIAMSLCGLSIIANTNADAVNAASGKQYDPKTLAQVEALYGLSEDDAITRLAKEYDAAVQARRIEARHLPGYAGSWFDSATQNLHVATSDSADFTAIEQVGAIPVLVDHNLNELDGSKKAHRQDTYIDRG